MTGPATFEDPTRWDPGKGSGLYGSTGWAVPGQSRWIEDADRYWGQVLDRARVAYGDPNIHYNTDNTRDPRFLVFGDGTRLPADRTVVYHDAASQHSWVQNGDGTVALQNPGGHLGPALPPAAYRHHPDGSYAPIDDHGQQIGPWHTGMPVNANGFHTDSSTGLLTPKNRDGDYYTVDPGTGARHFFDQNGHPISAQRYGAAQPGTPPAPLATDTQQSGRTADAVRKLHDELKRRASTLGGAEQTLAETLLSAQSTTTDGRQKLDAIQAHLVDAVNNPALSLDTPAGERAFLTFLQSQLTAILAVVSSGALTAEDQAKAVEALAHLYGATPADGDTAPADSTGPSSDAGTPANAAAAQPDPGPVAGPADLLGPPEPMPDPTLSDVLAGIPAGAPTGVDPLAGLGSMLPAALGSGVPIGGSGGGDPFGALAGGLGPLAGLGSQLGAQAGERGPADDTAHPDSDSGDRRHDDSGDGRDDTGDSTSQDHNADNKSHSGAPADPGPAAPESTPAAVPGGAAPAAALAAPPPTAVPLPDGSSATARTPALATAVKAYLAGTPVDDAYRQAGLQLPPPGTPVTSPVDPSQLSAGAVGMYQDHYVVALSPAKALQDGQVVALSAAAAGPGFLGWLDPAAHAGAPAPPTPVPAAAG